ncbi:MAG: DUF1156 domain-containing protein, partial [Acidobacteriaceae bacterium]|nr:DUF1156 domain-containing protein [Acidobacteriaceae bacterium]
KFLWTLGIHGDPSEAKKALARAVTTGVRVENPYGYERAFSYTPTQDDLTPLPVSSVLDPTAGGGSIPFEAVRIGNGTIANDLNPVASLLLKATVELPASFGRPLEQRFTELARTFRSRLEAPINSMFPKGPDGDDATYLWARTVTCPYCNGLVPLSPNWRLDSEGTGVRLVPKGKHIRFEIVHMTSEHSPGTVKDGTGKCPFPDCGREIDGDDIKKQAQDGRMGHQLYCVVYKYDLVVGKLKNGKPKTKVMRGFRAPRPEDDAEDLVQKRLAEKMPLWQARGIVPDEEFPEDANDDRPRQYGAPLWRDLFNPRQLYGHCTSVEVFHDLVEDLKASNGGDLAELDRAALTYIALCIDKMVDYNSIGLSWHAGRQVLEHTFRMHNFSFHWSYAEMVPTISGLGYDWVIQQVGKALGELIKLLGHNPDASQNGGLFPANHRHAEMKVLCQSADSLSVPPASVDCIVMDPPYYDNVMYAELSDFFYVWLKRTAGLLYPELFTRHLTDKDCEAVANPAKFAGQKGAKKLAHFDYQQRMARIFTEMRRVLKPGGIMTVMFTHKAKDAWDALATGLIEAGFVITASWPVHTEAEGSLHIREKAAAKSTIFLVCRLRDEAGNGHEPAIWEYVEPDVRGIVRSKVREFQEAGLAGIDLYLACFGPALEIFSKNWPLTRGTARQQPKSYQHDLFGPWDPYRVTPEDALDAARREVKEWRMEQLATVKRKHHLDPLTEWYVLAWDAFRAPKFPSDEALKLARVVGLDFDRELKNVACAVTGDDVTLWDSQTRVSKNKLTNGPQTPMLDRLHEAAYTVRFQNTEAARNRLESLRLLDDPTLLTGLEALLNVLPPVAPRSKKKADPSLEGAASDFEALEKLRRLAFAQKVPEPKKWQQTNFDLEESDAAD